MKVFYVFLMLVSIHAFCGEGEDSPKEFRTVIPQSEVSSKPTTPPVSPITQAWREGDFEKVVQLSAESAKSLPIEQFGQLAYRQESDKVEVPPQIDDRYVYFYKTVKKSQIDSIREQGLDSRLGGVDGASGKDSPMSESRDAGKQFLAQDFWLAMYFATVFYEDTKEEPVILLIKMPITQSLKLNLTHSKIDIEEWYVAGSVIPATWISYLEPPTDGLFEFVFSNMTETFLKLQNWKAPTDPYLINRLRFLMKFMLQDESSRSIVDLEQPRLNYLFKPIISRSCL